MSDQTGPMERACWIYSAIMLVVMSSIGIGLLIASFMETTQ